MQMPPGSYTVATLTYQWHCDRCKTVRHQPFLIRAKESIPWPDSIPEGWQIIGEMRFCPAHHIVIFVDQKLVGSEGQQ